MRFNRRCSKIINAETVAGLRSEIGCSSCFAQLLYERGIDTLDKYRRFTDTDLSGNDDPFGLPNMKKAVAALREAVNAKKRICIYGDYDVDGVCATVILYKILSQYTNNLRWYIPSRQTEGYGMHEESVKKLAADGVELIVTVDNGITAIEEAALAADLGIKMIITDHHRFNGRLPIAEAIVASSLNNYASEVNDFSGAGIAWMLARAFTGKPLTELLPYVALPIAADSVHVTGFNRAYLIHAFDLFRPDKHFNLLLKTAGMAEGSVNMHTLNFVLAPRINAAGRMKHADIAVRYFLSDSPAQMQELADMLEQLNSDRKSEENRIIESCLKTGDFSGNVLVFYGDGWNIGVLGIVASKLVEETGKNVFVLGKNAEGQYVGSGRNDSQTDLYSLLLPCADLLDRFGGHFGAAGLSVSEDHLFKFIEAVNTAYALKHPEGAPAVVKEYDLELYTEDCTAALAKEVNSLAPFGPDNPEPVFRVPAVSLSRISYMGKAREHLSCQINNSPASQNAGIRLVAFRHGQDYATWKRYAEEADVLITLSLNTFNGRESCEGILFALNGGLLSSENQEFSDLVNAFFKDSEYNKNVCASAVEKICKVLGFPSLTERNLRDLYVYLRRRYRHDGSFLSEFRSHGTAEEIAALLIFKELNLVKITEEKTEFINSPLKTDCHKSTIFAYCNKLGGNDNGT